MTFGDIDIKVLQYLVKQGSQVYIVTFANEVSVFLRNLLNLMKHLTHSRYLINIDRSY